MISDQSRDQKCAEDDSFMKIRISAFSLKYRIQDRHLMFNFFINNNENQLSLVDNESEAEFLNESFAHERNIKSFNLIKKNRVRLILEDDNVSQIVTQETYIDLKIDDHRKRLFCYLTRIESTLILKND